jgi:integrase
MASVNKKNGKLFIDFRHHGVRCKEYTKLNDTPGNRKRLTEIAKRIDTEITLGTFDYVKYFPKSAIINRFAERKLNEQVAQKNETVTFADFAQTWFAEKEAEWRNSYRANQRLTMDKYLLPNFGHQVLSKINKADILKFRSELTQQPGLKGQTLSSSRINHIMPPLRMILNEVADRNNFVTPFRNIKPLKVPRSDVDPFTLEEVNQIITLVRHDFKPYYTVRFFTALRTAEVDGLT